MVKDQFFQFLLLVPSLSLTDVVMLHFSRMWHSKHPKMTYTMFSEMTPLSHVDVQKGSKCFL